MANCSAIDYPRNVVNNRVYNTMIEDTFPAAEKILSDIENVLKKDPHLVSFEIIPVEDNENKSPVFYDEHSLGLASWCIQPLYCYAYNRLLDLRHNKHKREEPSTVARWLLGAILLNPDVTTFWNMRRELVKSNRLDPLKEFRFVSIVQYHSPKCFEAFAYRRWLIKLILLQNKHSCNVDMVPILQGEIRSAGISAGRYPNNCNAWSHRQHIITTFEEIATTELYSTLLHEWDDCTKWCDRHISDYSGFAYKQFLLKKLLLFENSTKSETLISEENLTKRRQIILKFIQIRDEDSLENSSNKGMLDILHGTESREQLKNVDYDQLLVNLSYWAEECLLNEELIDIYPGHEALWCHRRYLAHCLKGLTLSYKKYSSYRLEILDGRDGIRPKLEKEENCSSRLGTAFQEHNQKLLSNAKAIGQHHASLAEKFVKFLSVIELES